MRTEPPHHRPPAPGLDAAAGHTREREQRHQRAVIGSKDRPHSKEATTDETDGERGAFAVTVGCRKPHGSIATVSPIHSAASTTPISGQLRSSTRSRRSGAITAIANVIAENPAWAPVPAASTTTGNAALLQAEGVDRA